MVNVTYHMERIGLPDGSDDFHMQCRKIEVFPWFPVHLVTFAKEIPNRKLHFLCSDDGEQLEKQQSS